MTTVAIAPAPAEPSLLTQARWAVSDSLMIAKRNLLVWMRVPAYLVFTVGAFYVTVRAYGLPNVGPLEATAIYSFVLALVILVPLPSDLGLSEGSGRAVFLAYGVPLAQGLTIMLISRFAVLLFTEALAGAALMLFRGERHVKGELHDAAERVLAD